MEEHYRRIHTSKEATMSPDKANSEDNPEAGLKKRKLTPDSDEAETDTEKLLREVKRLRKENEEMEILREENARLWDKLAVKSEPQDATGI